METKDPPRKRGEYRKTRARREAIVAAALEVFGRAGYHKASLREVAELVSMSEAGLLHHFPTKAALLIAVLESRDEESYGIVDFEAPDPRDALLAVREVAQRDAAQPGVVEVFTMVAAEAIDLEHPAHTYFQERYARLLVDLSRLFERLAAAGGLRPGVDPLRLARGTLAIWDGLQVQWLLDRTSLDIADDLEAYLDLHLARPLRADEPRLAGVPDHGAAE